MKSRGSEAYVRRCQSNFLHDNCVVDVMYDDRGLVTVTTFILLNNHSFLIASEIKLFSKGEHREELGSLFTGKSVDKRSC